MSSINFRLEMVVLVVISLPLFFEKRCETRLADTA